MNWEVRAKAKRQSILELIPLAWRIPPSEIPSKERLRDVSQLICQWLNTREKLITNASLTRIIAEICSGEWTAIEVTQAFCHRAAIAHQLTQCLSEICFVAAEYRARELDEYYSRTGQVLGPLHGIPVSLQDRFNIAGLESASGYVSWLGSHKDADSEGVLVQSLRRSGAVFFVKTNVPMSMLMGETNNNIIGFTLNPYNRYLSAGGASGGEGSLLALRGAPLGWGSDIAGSIRIPCAFNNLYGLRPSSGRLPASGMTTSLVGLPILDSVVGPMASDLAALDLSVKTILGACPWRDDCDVVEMPWRHEKLQNIRSLTARPQQNDGKLAFAVLKCDGNVRPHPPVQRAISLVTQALLQRGYEVIEWDPPSHDQAAKILFQILGCTAGQDVRSAIDASGEPPVHQLSSWYANDNVNPSSSAELWDLCEQRDRFRAAYHRYWSSTCSQTSVKRPVDGVIMPVAPSAATKEGEFTYFTYTAIVNLLDYTAGAFPVSFADASLDASTTHHVPLNSTDRSVWNTYDKDIFEGAPVGLQVMAKRFEEEKVIGLMEALAAALAEYRSTPNSRYSSTTTQ